MRFASTLAVTLLCWSPASKQRDYPFYTPMMKYIYAKPAKSHIFQKPVSKLKGIIGKLYINLVPKVVNNILGWCNWNKIFHIWKQWTVWKFKLFIVVNLFPDLLCKVWNLISNVNLIIGISEPVAVSCWYSVGHRILNHHYCLL